MKTMKTTTTKTLHESLLKELASYIYADGTYNLETMEPVEFDDGYQVTFCQIGAEYTEESYDSLVTLFRETADDGNVYAGKFEGEPEISFHFADKDTAILYAKVFNQISIWSWKDADEIKTGGTGRV